MYIKTVIKTRHSIHNFRDKMFIKGWGECEYYSRGGISACVECTGCGCKDRTLFYLGWNMYPDQDNFAPAKCQTCWNRWGYTPQPNYANQPWLIDFYHIPKPRRSERIRNRNSEQTWRNLFKK